MIDVDATIQAIRQDLASRLDDAGEIMAQAVVNAYVAEGHVKSWDMAKAVFYTTDPEALKIKVISPVYYSSFLEHGSKHQPARHVVTRAVHAAIPAVMDVLNGGNE